MSRRGPLLSREELPFAGGALFFVTLLLSLIINPELVQNVVVREISERAPLLKAGETFPLTAESLVQPELNGAFSSYERDGVWLLQGEGIVTFRLTPANEASLIEIGIGTLPTTTSMEVRVNSSDAVHQIFLQEENRTISIPLQREENYTLSVSCRISGNPVDLGLDIRDLCVKFLWLRIS